MLREKGNEGRKCRIFVRLLFVHLSTSLLVWQIKTCFSFLRMFIFYHFKIIIIIKKSRTTGKCYLDRVRFIRALILLAMNYGRCPNKAKTLPFVLNCLTLWNEPLLIGVLADTCIDERESQSKAEWITRTLVDVFFIKFTSPKQGSLLVCVL